MGTSKGDPRQFPHIMKHAIILLLSLLVPSLLAAGTVTIDAEAFGESLGGWKKRGKQAAEYGLSGTTYRTYKPEVSPTPDGGIFASVRIDHVRGWLSSDDHAILEVTINAKGMIVSAQSNIAIQGRSISSDVILGTNEAGRQAAGGVDRAVQIGTDLVADLSAKLLREKVVEAGRVSFPAALRHNYNLLFQAIRLDGRPLVLSVAGAPVAVPVEPPEPASPAGAGTPADAPTDAPTEPTAPVTAPSPEPAPTEQAPTDPATAPPAGEEAHKPLQIKPYATPKGADLQ